MKVIGLVDALGASGGSAGGEAWSLIFHFAAWRRSGLRVRMDRMRCELPVERSDVSPLMMRVRPYSIVEVEAAGRNWGDATMLRRIVRFDVADADLKEISERLRRPIVLDDPTFGRLTYDRKLNSYEGNASWCGASVGIGLDCPNPAKTHAVLDNANALFDDQAEWNRRVSDFAVEHLLHLKNKSWLEENEEPLAADDFVSRMKLQSIYVEASGFFTFWYDDGDLFWGNAIAISGSLKDGLTDADIPG